MKTFTRMIGRYVLATAAVVLLVVGLLLGAVVYLGLHYGEAADSRVRIGTLAVENLLHNAACHNPGPVQVQLSAVRTGKTLRITIADDGAGYPPAVLHALQTGEAGENTPHILGLHVVEQIIRAHGGTAAFARNAPRGAKAVLVLPVTEDPAAR